MSLASRSCSVLAVIILPSSQYTISHIFPTDILIEVDCASGAGVFPLSLPIQVSQDPFPQFNHLPNHPHNALAYTFTAPPLSFVFSKLLHNLFPDIEACLIMSGLEINPGPLEGKPITISHVNINSITSQG